jgi:hypothetical protein
MTNPKATPTQLDSSAPATQTVDDLIAVARAEEVYADVLGALDKAGYGGSINDLGGDCVVIFVPLDDAYDRYLTIAGQSGSLPADRGTLGEWLVQQYELPGTQEQATYQYPASDGAALVARLVAADVL